MSPLGDELRSALSARAATVAPSPDPLAGIEQRARRIRRNRTTAAALGAALAVSVIAVGVPVLASSSGGSRPSQLATASATEATPTLGPTSGSTAGPNSGPTTAPTTTPTPVVAPGHASPSPSVTPAAGAGQPATVLSWPPTGPAPTTGETADLLARFARSLGRPAGLPTARYRALKSYLTESGVRYTAGQAWFDGDRVAYDVSYARDRTAAPVFARWRTSPAGPAVLVFLLRIAPTFTSDLLVVVPRPGVGQVSYSPDATTAFLPVASGRSDANGSALLPRAPGTTADRLQVLDGDGNLDRPRYRGPVDPVLCGAPACG